VWLKPESINKTILPFFRWNRVNKTSSNILISWPTCACLPILFWNLGSYILSWIMLQRNVHINTKLLFFPSCSCWGSFDKNCIRHRLKNFLHNDLKYENRGIIVIVHTSFSIERMTNGLCA
jgi:hypothetical protein